MKRLLITALLTTALAACSGCADLSLHQKVAVSCETAASALDTLTAAKASGNIDADQLLDAIRIYESAVVPLCVPVADSMTAVQKAALAGAIAELTRRAGALDQ
jgi:hypothetical protein